MSVYETLRTQLEPLLGQRTEAVLQEGLKRLQLSPEALTPSQAAQILKRVVYRELQGVMSAAEAKRKVQALLEALGEGPPVEARLAELEAGLKRFNLYFEWPEVQRLRGMIHLIRRELAEGRDVHELLAEGRELLEILEEKLQSALLRQARDISDLEAAFERVKTVGGPKVRRLEALIRQIQEAQAQETLAPAEVERARALAAELRKLVESSVIQTPAPNESEEGLITVDDSLAEDEEFELVIDLDQLTPEQAGRIKEIDLTEDRRRLEVLAERYAPLLEREELRQEHAALAAQLEAGEPLGDALEAFEARLQQAHQEALAEARARYEWLAERLRALEAAGVDPGPVRTRLDLVKESLDARVLPKELPDLEQAVAALEAQLEAQRKAQAQRETLLKAQRAFIEEARAAIAPYRDAPHPELTAFLEALDQLEARTQSGEVDEAQLAHLKNALAQLLADLAHQREEGGLKRAHLRAALQALPDLPELGEAREALLAELEAAPLEALTERVEALTQRARELVQARLQTLRAQAERFQLPLDALSAAEAQLAAGEFPDLTALERHLTHALEARKEQVRELLNRFEAVAQSYKGLGGEPLLQRIQEIKSRLDEEIPDLAPLQEALAQLQRRKQELRTALRRRYDHLRKAYATYQRVGGETAHQVGVLLNFLDSGVARLDRLGIKGLLEFQRALEEAEKYLAQLELEYTAAQEVAQELKGADLDQLLAVFTPEEPPKRAAVLEPFQVRGVDAAVLLENGRVLAGERPSWLEPALVEALVEDAQALGAEIGAPSAKLIVLTLPDHALIVVPLKARQLVLLAEKALLSKLVNQVERSYAALLEA